MASSSEEEEEEENDAIVVKKTNLESFSQDVDSLWTIHSNRDNNVAVLDAPPDAFTFLRDFVSMSRPCIIRNAIPQSSRQQRHRNNETNNSFTDSNNRNNGKPLSSVPLTLSLDELVDVCHPHPRNESTNYDDTGCDDGVV